MNMLALLVVAGLAAAQAPQQPQSSQDTPPKPRPALKLNLDEVDPPRSRITFEPKDKKPEPEKNLPGMGGERRRDWEATSEKIFPPDTNPGMR